MVSQVKLTYKKYKPIMIFFVEISRIIRIIKAKNKAIGTQKQYQVQICDSRS